MALRRIFAPFLVLLSRLYRDSYADVREADTLERLRRDSQKLDKTQTGIISLAGKNPNYKEAQNAVRDHRKAIDAVVSRLHSVIAFEFASYQKAIAEPQQAIGLFINALKAHYQGIQDVQLKRIVRELMDRITAAHTGILDEVQREITKTDEVFEREASGASSEYAYSVGDMATMEKIMEGKALQKRTIDRHVREALNAVKDAARRIEEYIQLEKPTLVKKLPLSGEVKVGEWLQVGNSEFKQNKAGRWIHRQAGGKGIGMFASKKVLQESGIFHYELLKSLRIFDAHFEELVALITNRIRLSQQIMGAAGYLLHTLQKEARGAFMQEEVAWLKQGDRKAAALAQEVAREEERHIKESEQAAVAMGQATLGRILASRRAVPALVGAALALTAVGAGGDGDYGQTAVQPSSPRSKTVAVGETVLVEVVQRRLRQDIMIEIKHNFNSTERLNAADSVKRFFPRLAAALDEAAKKEGVDRAALLRQHNVRVSNVQVNGGASVDGRVSYNVGLSGRRGNAEQQLLAAELKSLGIPVEGGISVVAQGELGEQEFLAAVDALLQDRGSRDRYLTELAKRLSNQSKKKLKELWLAANASKGAGHEIAVNNLAKAVRQLRGAGRYLDATLLAPYRKVVVTMTLEYDSPVPVGQTGIHFITVDELPDHDKDEMMAVDKLWFMPGPLPPGIAGAPGRGSYSSPKRYLPRERVMSGPRKNRPRGESRRSSGRRGGAKLVRL